MSRSRSSTNPHTSTRTLICPNISTLRNRSAATILAKLDLGHDIEVIDDGTATDTMAVFDLRVGTFFVRACAFRRLGSGCTPDGGDGGFDLALGFEGIRGSWSLGDWLASHRDGESAA
jgi:hypothetical protein